MPSAIPEPAYPEPAAGTYSERPHLHLPSADALSTGTSPPLLPGSGSIKSRIWQY
jgi:hypothetical protein